LGTDAVEEFNFAWQGSKIATATSPVIHIACATYITCR
jgi:hypothetical protein